MLWVYALRLLVIIGCFYNLYWSLRGLEELRRGNQSLFDIIRASVACSVLASLVFQFGNMVEPADIKPWRIVGLMLMLISQVLFRWVHIRATKKGRHTINIILSHVPESLAISDLAGVDPDAANRLAAEARRLTAERLAHG